jgi:hypothetical protein
MLLSPTQPEFDESARPLLAERIADIGLRLKPMLVIVANENTRTVVSLSPCCERLVPGRR